jgi:uncharacterized membrane protein
MYQLIGEIKAHMENTVKAMEAISDNIGELFDKLSCFQLAEKDIADIKSSLKDLSTIVDKIDTSVTIVKDGMRNMKSDIVNDVLTQNLIIKKHKSEETPVGKQSEGMTLVGFLVKEWKFFTVLLVIVVFLLSVALHPQFILDAFAQNVTTSHK